MLFPVRRIAKPSSWQRQGAGMLCCLLGLIWIGNPSFHSFCHLVDLPHQHPTGSAFSHGHGHDHSHSHGHDHDHDHGAGHSHHHDATTNDLADGRIAREPTPDTAPDAPPREPSDSEGPFIFMQSLETETCCSANQCLTLKQALPALDLANLDSVDFFSSVELGTIGPRGPPSVLDLRYLKKA